MLRSARQQQQAVATRRTWNLVVFSIGGIALAAKAEEVGGVAPWGDSIPIPSRTPFVESLLIRDKDLLPVYDLASRLQANLRGDVPLCLVIRHPDGPLAIGVDGDIPTLLTLDAGKIGPSRRQDLDTLGSFETDGRQVEILALQRLGRR